MLRRFSSSSSSFALPRSSAAFFTAPFVAAAATSSCITSSLRHQSGGPNLETLLTGTNAQWLESMYDDWVANPASVDEHFGRFFAQVQSMEPITMHGSASTTASSGLRSGAGVSTAGGAAHDAAQGEVECKGKRWLDAFKNSTTPEAQKALNMILEFETSGHTQAALDPLDYIDKEGARSPLCKRKVGLDPAHMGLTEADLDMVVPIGFCDNLGGFYRSTTPDMTLRELHARLSAVYTGKIGWEYMHIDDFEERKWLRNHIETSDPEPVDRKTILNDLADGVAFETFLHRKYGVTKRFGLEGGESLIPGLRSLINRSVDRHSARKFVLGMAHRGRLNVLVNVCGKPLRAVFKEFDSITHADLPDDGRQGDVKYHLGWSSEMKSRGRKTDYKMQLMFNPSHLEAVNPIVQGFSRCLQDLTTSRNGLANVIPIVLHGDAAFSGQGIVYEDIMVSELPKYTTGGTIHIVTNNQVGYTTNPADSRSSLHSSDIARGFACPIFHVNSDAPEDVVRVFNLAADYRATFNKSVVIDLVCYRRRGHNEGDDASMTQPGMYRIIANTPNVFEKYKTQMVEGKVVSENEAEVIFEDRMELYKTEKEEATSFDYKSFLMAPPKNWEQHVPLTAGDAQQSAATTISATDYKEISEALTETFPAGFKRGFRMDSIYDQRKEALSQGNVDYATAEALAIGSLLKEGFSFRISGQDVQRGTFAQRHYVVHDEETGKNHCPLKMFEKKLNEASKLPVGQRPHFSVTNSALSEYGVMGYDTGYSLVSPKRITLWEAQFGDFYNGAQVIVDQFLVSGFTKWGLQYNTIISLPHGYDGQGPEHSSARLERFLQLVSEDEQTPDFPNEAAQHWSNNIEIIVLSTSESYFHLLRRFAHRNFRRPTFIFFSKSRLRERTSSLEDFVGENRAFLPVIPDEQKFVTDDAAVKRVVLTQGQIYFDVIKYMTENRSATEGTAVLRIEQLAPFPKAALLKQLARYSNATDIVWVQQEPENMGAWQYLEPRFEHALRRGAVRLVSRASSASPATGSPHIHKMEAAKIMRDIFTEEEQQ